MLSDTMKLLLSLSVSGGILALLLFAVKPFIRNRLSKAFQYYIWLMVLARLMLPMSSDLNIVGKAFMPATESISQPAKPSNFQQPPLWQDDLLTPSQPQVAPVDPQQLPVKKPVDFMLLLWISGASVSLLWHLIAYLRFIMILSKKNNDASSGETAQLHALAGGRKVALSRNPLVKTPMMLGLLRPRIVLPDFSYSEAQINNILLHELMHLRRGDIAIKWLIAVVTAIHWFNPAVYFIRREMNRACELSCDEAVIKSMDRDSKQIYGDTLISVVADSRHPAGVLSTTMCEDKKILKERLLAIMNYKNKSRTILAVSVALLSVMFFSAIALGAFRSEAGSPDPSESATPYHQAFLNKLLAHKTPYIGDNSKVASIAQILPPPDSDMKYSHIALQTETEPYGLTIYYIPDKTITEYPAAEHANPDGEYAKRRDKNLVILFSLIDNLGYVSLDTDFTSVDNGHHVVTITRSSFEPWATHNEVWAENGKKLLELFKMIDMRTQLPQEGAVIDDGKSTPSQPLIHQYLDIIMSSPKASSSTGDFIREHRQEYDAILAMGYEALPELLKILQSKDTGLRGNIAALLSEEIMTAMPPAGDQWEQIYKTGLKILYEWKNAMGYILPTPSPEPMPEFTKEEVAAARRIVEDYFKDDLSKTQNVKRTLLDIRYDSQDSFRRSYRPSEFPPERIIVFKVDFNIQYLGGNPGAWNKGDYKNWSMILVRDEPSSDWELFDQGY